jgi:N-acetylmuramidase-like protein/putative peptidoglycan binding protein
MVRGAIWCETCRGIDRVAMNLRGTGRPFDQEGMDDCCGMLGVNAAAVWAVLTVETRGFGFLADRRPQILFERHIFHRLTNGRFDSVNSNLSNSLPGGYVGGVGEYTRLEEAMDLDQDSAVKSASWGIAQIMGFNFGIAGFPTVDEMVAAMVKDEGSQLSAMAEFIVGNHLDAALRDRDWTFFARSYNGADFERNQYDARLAAAYAKATVVVPDLDLRTAQAALAYLGIDPGPIDGLRGRRTRSALIDFQQSRALPPSGDLDEVTNAALLAEAFPDSPGPTG